MTLNIGREITHLKRVTVHEFPKKYLEVFG